MNMNTINHHAIIHTIKGLPAEALPELAEFINFLKFKMNMPQVENKKKPSDFLMSIADLGASDEDDISERAEEILSREISSVNGWTIKE